VLFISSHRFPFYPGTGALSESGAGKGMGTSINFPLPKAYGDDYFVTLYADIVGKMLKSFSPDMILVSAGFDGHRADPMGGFQLSTQAYGTLAEILIARAEENNGKILFCLEGGYHPEALRDSVKEVLQKMREMPRGKIVSSPNKPGLSTLPDSSLEEFVRFHRAFFPELQF
jgi:acetoin utilization deacetylase AcuC-like enzyme